MPSSASSRLARVVLALGICGFISMAAPAVAHEGLLIGVPGPGATVGGEVNVIQLYFEEPMTEAVVRMEGPLGEMVEGTLDQPTPDLLEFRIDSLAEEGPYIVRYAVVFEDEAVFQSAFQFAYEVDGHAVIPIEVANRQTGQSLVSSISLGVLIACVVGLFALLLWRYRQLRRSTAARSVT